MPLLLSPDQIATGQYGIRPIVTPAGTAGVYVQNVSSLSLTLNSRLGSIQIPPAFVATLPMDENDQITFSATPPATVAWPAKTPQYIDLSYSFVPVAPAGTGLFVTPLAPGGDAINVNVNGSSIPNFTVIAQGTITTASSQTSVNTPSISPPSILTKQLVLSIYNNSGQAISGVYAVADNATIDTFTGSDLVIGTLQPEGGSITNATAASVLLNSDVHPHLFIQGAAHFTFTLNAATTAAGSINWSLISY